MSQDPQKTPLSDFHQKSGGKMVDFAGWWMPVEFEGLRLEHLRVREKAGLFDVSHMGEIRIKGLNSLETLEWLTTNLVGKLEPGQAQYTLLTNFEGGIVDDLIVYCLEKNKDYLLCVNAANIEKDFKWIQENNKSADIINESEQWGQIAIQGPKAVEIVKNCFDSSVEDIQSFHFAQLDFDNSKVLIARTGYTGEDGFEIFTPAASTEKLWAQLLEQGKDLGAQPIGLGARDTLRTEMKYSLYGHEIDDTTNPYEAGLGWVVKPKTKDFIGKQKILQLKEQGLNKKLIGFVMLERGIPRQGYPLINSEGREIGMTTSGTLSPTRKDYIGIGYLPTDYARPDTEILVQIRSKQVKAKVVKTPFVNPKGE